MTDAKRYGFGKKWDGPQGEVKRHWLDSGILSANRLGDPARRALDIYLPAGHDPAGLPLLFCLAAFGKSGLAHTGWQGEKENLPERLDRLIGTGAMKPAVVAFPDCYTSMGGSQFVDSPVLGPFASYLTEEVLPFVEDETGAGGPGKRGLFGHSSGGYGALFHGMRHADVWDGIAAHAPDCAFELGYLPDWPGRLTQLSRYDGIADFLGAFNSKLKPGWPDKHLMMLLAMAGSYDAVEDTAETPLGLRLPLNAETAELNEKAWANWLKFDPAQMIKTEGAAMKTLKAVWLDVGAYDQFHLHYGARRLAREMEKQNIPHHFEVFEDDHSGIDYRLDLSLPYLAERLG